MYCVTLSLLTEEVGDSEQSDRAAVSVSCGDEFLGEAVLPAAAGVGPELQQNLDVLPGATQSLQTSLRIPQRPLTGGESEGHIQYATYLS